MVLEGVARCGAFDVVLLALLTTQKDRVVGRLAYGDGAQGCLASIAAPLERGAGVIAECILTRAPAVYPAGTAALLVPPGTSAPRLPITLQPSLLGTAGYQDHCAHHRRSDRID